MATKRFLLSRRSSGMVLIFTAGVLAILAAIGTAFFAISQSGTTAAVRYADMVRADLMARGGVAFAVSKLREQAFEKAEDPSDPWFMVNYLKDAEQRISYAMDDPVTPGAKLPYSKAMTSTIGESSDRFLVEVSDAASKINVNACDNLAVILDNLCRLIGPPLTPADLTMTQPYRWYVESNNTLTDYNANTGDTQTARDIYYAVDANSRPLQKADGTAIYGDGYAIAGYRSRNGMYSSLSQVKQALTFVDRNGNGALDDPLELLEVEAKFAALRPYLTVDAWVDTTTVSVGKFEWATPEDSPITIAAVRNIVSGALEVNIPCQVLIDRDKSWVADDPENDPENKRGSLRGSYVAIINGHGAGQLRRIATNGIDWIALYGYAGTVNESMVVPPGPISSYMIIAREDAVLYQPKDDLGNSLIDSSGNPLYLPQTDADNNKDDDNDGTVDNEPGIFVDDPNIDYSRHPLCIHRSPVNINTASDKVLAALFMGINVTHGNFMSVGTDADIQKLAGGKSRWAWNGNTDPDWKINDYDDPTKNPHRTVEPYILTPKGLKRIPADKGHPEFPVDWDGLIEPNLPASYSMDYIGNNGTMDPNDATNTKINEAQELAFRIIIARQPDATYPYIDPATGVPKATGNPVYERQPFRSWDDFYFRVVKPWDDSRLDPVDSVGNPNPRFDPKRGSVARLIMANFNSNLDVLKYNPNIEWIDRYGRNFTEMEPVMVFTNEAETWRDASLGHGATDILNDPNLDPPNPCDVSGVMNNNAVPIFTRERDFNYPRFSLGTFGDDPRFMGSYTIRSYRYKGDEMIDKTDLNRSTTEFAFDSNGIYQIVSTGQIIHPSTGQLLAERKLESLVKVYEVWRETTQRQFVKGYISRATGQTGSRASGSIARDVNNENSRLALTTLPEALVPLRYRMGSNAAKFKEVVDTTLGTASRKRDAWGNIVTDMTRPDILSNYVQPAGYDGQIVLATNTLRYDPSDAGDGDTFLASFNGDLDTETCRGIGREQAKTPVNCKVRVLDTCGLLGLLNDRMIDTDPGLRGNTGPWQPPPVVEDTPPYVGSSSLNIWRYRVTIRALRGLDPRYYWNNISCRQGDLRPDGLYVSGAGIAGNDGVFKYLCGYDGNGYTNNMNFSLNGPGAVHVTGENGGNRGSYGDHQGFLMTCWTKTQWHHDDGRNHDFFDCTLPGWNDSGIRAEAFVLRKHGRVQWAICERRTTGSGMLHIYNSTSQVIPEEDTIWGISGSGNRVNDFGFISECQEDGNGDWSEPDWPIYLHGGESGLVRDRLNPLDTTDYRPESPAYRIQPFRWHYLGTRVFLQKNFAQARNGPFPGVSPNGVPGGDSAGKSGFHKPRKIGECWKDQRSVWVAMNLFRPFVDSERWPETDYQPYGKYWIVYQGQGSTGFNCYQAKGRAGKVEGRGNGGPHVRWRWAHPGGIKVNTVDGRNDLWNFTVFGINNCNPGYDYCDSNQFCSIYKNSPDEGLYAVIDEYKLSRKERMLKSPSEPNNDRVTRNDASKPGEMTLSRYYTPADPTAPYECPTFTSQTLLQSRRGFNMKTAPNPEYVTLTRVSWNVFTPRFMVEYKRPSSNYTRTETITKNYQTTSFVGAGDSPSSTVRFRGPFDYCIYNNIECRPNGGGERKYTPHPTDPIPVDYDVSTYDANAAIWPYRCARPTPAQYVAANRQPHASRGVEVELLEDVDDNPANGNEVIRAGPFVDPAPYIDMVDTVSGSQPNKINAIGTARSPVRVRVDRLRYRVRFRYYVDRFADKQANANSRDEIDVNAQYVLDTPVFDDISVTYFDKVKVLDYREVTE